MLLGIVIELTKQCCPTPLLLVLEIGHISIVTQKSTYLIGVARAERSGAPAT